MNLFKRKQPRLPIVNITDLPAKEIHYCIVHGCELQEIGIVGDVEYDIDDGHPYVMYNPGLKCPKRTSWCTQFYVKSLAVKISNPEDFPPCR